MNGQTAGPFTIDELTHLRWSGQVGLHTPVVEECGKKWTPLEEILRANSERPQFPPPPPPAAKNAPPGIWLVIVLGIFLYTFCMFNQNVNISTAGVVDNASSTKTLTKHEWKRKVAAISEVADRYIINNYVAATKESLSRAVGAASQEQVLGDEIYLYYECKDGTIQVVTRSANYEYGWMFVGQINEF